MTFDIKAFKGQVQLDLSINEYDLQGEWAKQANLFMHYSMKMSSLTRKKELHRALLVDKIVADPSTYGLEKLTDAAINRVVDNDETTIELAFQASMYGNAVKACEHKKRALEYDCQLMIGGFFSEPKTKKPLKKKG